MEVEKDASLSLLHILLFRPVLKLQTAERIVAELNDRRTIEVDLDSVIHRINAKVGRHGQRLSKQTCDVTGNEFLILSNISKTAATQSLSGAYTKEEREIYKRILAEIMTSDTMGCISSTHVLNMAHDMPFQITKGRLQDTVDHLLKDGWFCKKDGKIYIGVRSVTEMTPFITEVYKDCLSNCYLCKNCVFVGVTCGCGEIFHKYCVEKMERIMASEYHCPKCNTELQP